MNFLSSHPPWRITTSVLLKITFALLGFFFRGVCFFHSAHSYHLHLDITSKSKSHPAMGVMCALVREAQRKNWDRSPAKSIDTALPWRAHPCLWLGEDPMCLAESGWLRRWDLGSCWQPFLLRWESWPFIWSPGLMERSVLLNHLTWKAMGDLEVLESCFFFRGLFAMP